MTTQTRRSVRVTALTVTVLLVAAAIAAFLHELATSEDSRAGAASPRIALREVDGGPSYYKRFPRSLPASSSFFPVGVWFESVTSQADIDIDKRAGLNTYVALTADSNLSLLAEGGMKAIVQHEEWVTKAEAQRSSAVAGWLLWDEVDMQKKAREGFDGLQSIRAKLPAGDGRIRFNNYGKGVTFWNSDAEAGRYASSFQDVVSADNYWFTDRKICGATEGGALFGGRTLSAQECHRASNYGKTVDRLRGLISPARSKPVWGFVEVGHPFAEGDWPSIQARQVSAAVWSSIIHGARGIIYFNHSFGGPSQTQHALREPAYASIRAEVTRTNRRIGRLAPVLNASFVDGLVKTAPAIDTMAKFHGGHFYIFAGNRTASAQRAVFRVPCTGDAEVTVLDEGRRLRVRRGVFTDDFADGDAVHIYRIDGGSTCGLVRHKSGDR